MCVSAMKKTFGKDVSQKNYKYLLYSALTTFLLCSFADIAIAQREKDLGKPAQLKAELELYKREYLLRESIIVKMRVTNIGKEEGWLYFVTTGGLKIKDSKGQEYTCHVSSSLAPGIINLGQTLEEQTNLLLWFGIPENKFKVRHYLPPERYTILYKPRKDVSSETYEFSVLEPKGDEIQAMNLLKDSYQLFVEKKYDETIEKLEELISKYPNSVYRPWALFETATTYKLAIEDLDKTLEIYRKVIDNHPNSREAVEVLSYLVYYYETGGDTTELSQYLNQVKVKYSNTAVSEAAEKELRKVKGPQSDNSKQ